MLQELGMIFATLPVAPFTAPPPISIPSNIPSIPAGTYRKSSWLDMASFNTPSFRVDTYIRTPRKRGNIVSIYAIQRSIRKENPKLNRHTKDYGSGMFLPSYDVDILRYDCQNGRYSQSSALLITDAWDGGTGFVYPIDTDETKWREIPGQAKVMLEGRPYWAVQPQRFPDYGEKPVEWNFIVPESNGASMIDYACTNF